jgi:hypothetical protein
MAVHLAELASRVDVGALALVPLNKLLLLGLVLIVVQMFFHSFAQLAVVGKLRINLSICILRNDSWPLGATGSACPIDIDLVPLDMELDLVVIIVVLLVDLVELGVLLFNRHILVQVLARLVALVRG